MKPVIYVKSQWIDDIPGRFVAFSEDAPEVFGVGDTREDAEDDMLEHYNNIVWH